MEVTRRDGVYNDVDGDTLNDIPAESTESKVTESSGRKRRCHQN